MNKLANLIKTRMKVSYIDKDTFKIDCPFCLEKLGRRDFKQHLHIYHAKGEAYCFRCKALYKSSIYLIKDLFNVSYQEASNLLLQAKDITSPNFETNVSKNSKLPRCVPIETDKEALHYISKRGFTSDDCYKYSIGLCKDNDDPANDNRIIFFIKEKGVIVGYTGRTFLTGDVRKRYLIPEGWYKKKSELIYMPPMPHKIETIVLTEGALDTITFDKYFNSLSNSLCCGLLTNKISESQLNTVLNLRRTYDVKHILIWLDMNCQTDEVINLYKRVDGKCYTDLKIVFHNPVAKDINALIKIPPEQRHLVMGSFSEWMLWRQGVKNVI